MSRKLQVATVWFPSIGAATPGHESTISGDGSYDGEYESVSESWLISREGGVTRYAAFAEFWKSLAPSMDDLARTLEADAAGILGMLKYVAGNGRPITRHFLWDGMPEVEKFRDPVIEDGRIVFFVYIPSGLLSEAPRKQASIDQIRFDLLQGTFLREHVLELQSNV